MIAYNPDYSVAHLKKLRKFAIYQLQIHQKASKVMSETPPNEQLAASIKAKYIKTSRLVLLPPINLTSKKPRLKASTKSGSPLCKILPHVKKSSQPLDLGIIHGLPKYLSKRRRSKSQEIQKPKKPIEVRQVEYLTTDSDKELSPMTILVKLKEHNI